MAIVLRASRHMVVSSHASIDIETLATTLRRELGTLHSLSNQCCIYRVPERLRHLNEKAYTPRIVSIGPLHHGREELKAMEEHKRRYLQNFLQRTKVSLEDFIQLLKKKEARVRSSYVEAIGLGSDDFVKMVLVDAAFIIEVLLQFSLFGNHSRNDRIFDKPWMIIDVKHDMWLLENQLPFFILQDLFTLADIVMLNDRDERHTLVKLNHEFSKYFWGSFQMEENLDERKYLRVEHLVDFLRTSILPSDLQEQTCPKILTTPSVMELHQAGVKFMVGSSKNLFDIRFNNGVLEIPQIRIRSPLESLLRNLLAFEQCHYFDNHINDFIIMMNYLVNTPEDVDLLVQNGIIENQVRDSEEVSTLFHNLVAGTTLHPQVFYFSCLVEDLNRYCKTPWHKWKATLKQDYFNTPWAAISVSAAVILLICTFVQTMCSFLAL